MQTNEALDPSARLLALSQSRAKLQAKLKGGANWFYWIAGMSLINSIIYIVGGSLNFVVGLGITQVIDGITNEIAAQMGSSGLMYVGFVVDVLVALLFVLFGFFANKGHKWAFITGMVLYTLDMLIFLIDPLALIASILFHLWALFGLFQGVKAIKPLQELDRSAQAPLATIEPVANP